MVFIQCKRYFDNEVLPSQICSKQNQKVKQAFQGVASGLMFLEKKTHNKGLEGGLGNTREESSLISKELESNYYCCKTETDYWKPLWSQWLPASKYFNYVVLVSKKERLGDIIQNFLKKQMLIFFP